MSDAKQKKLTQAMEIITSIVGPNPNWDDLHAKDNWKALRSQALPIIAKNLGLRASTSTPNCYFAHACKILSAGKRKRAVGGGRKVKQVAAPTDSNAINSFLTGAGASPSKTFGVASL